MHDRGNRPTGSQEENNVPVRNIPRRGNRPRSSDGQTTKEVLGNSEKELNFEESEKVICYLFTKYPLFAELVDTIGIDNALLLVQIFGGTKLHVPTSQEIKKVYRDYRIYRDAKKYRDLRRASILEKYGISSKQLQNIMNRFNNLFSK